MIIVACLICRLAIRILGDPLEVERLVGSESEFWPTSYPCPECGAMAKGMKEAEADPIALNVMEMKELTPAEAFIAFNGMGLPSERACGEEQVRALFQTPVRKVVGQQAKTGRFVIEHIQFWDGTKLYLGASPSGAVVYKISAPPAYTLEASRA